MSCREKAKNYPESYFFIKALKRCKHRGTFLILCKRYFWSHMSNGTNITENCFASQNERHTDKLSFSGILKHFRGN